MDLYQKNKSHIPWIITLLSTEFHMNTHPDWKIEKILWIN